MTEEIKIDKVNVVLLNASTRLYNDLIKIVGDDKINKTNIISIVTNLMQIVENYNDIVGVKKKEVIINTLVRFIENNIEEPHEENEIKSIVSVILPTVIDTFISIDKKEVRIKLKKHLLACCKLS